MTDERVAFDLDEYERRTRGGPCFVWFLAGDPDYRHETVYSDEHVVAFLGGCRILTGGRTTKGSVDPGKGQAEPSAPSRLPSGTTIGGTGPSAVPDARSACSSRCACRYCSTVCSAMTGQA